MNIQKHIEIIRTCLNKNGHLDLRLAKDRFQIDIALTIVSNYIKSGTLSVKDFKKLLKPKK